MAITKQQIEDAFEKRVNRFGYAKTTLDEIASDLRISKKTLYAHFDGKADIYRHIVERSAMQSRSELSAAVAAMPTFGEKLAGMVRMVMQGARAHVRETERAEWEAEYVVAEEAFREALSSVLADIVSGGVGAGEFAVKDPALAVRMIGVVLFEYALMMREEPDYDRDEELASAIRRFVG